MEGVYCLLGITNRMIQHTKQYSTAQPPTEGETLMSDIRLIALDMDGTLLNSDHQLSPTTIDYLLAVQDAGYKIVVATGRARLMTAVDVIQQLKLSTLGIFLQGTVIHHANGDIFHEETLPSTIATAILTRLAQENRTALAYQVTDIFTGQQNNYTDYVISLGEAPPQAIGDLTPQAHRIHKLVIWDTAETIRKLRDTLEQDYPSEAFTLVEALPAHLIKEGKPISLEILPNHASKGYALEKVAAHYGVTLEQVLAVGDGENDIPMLKAAGIGVAMGNAAPATQAIADYITTDNDQDGVVKALQHFLPPL